MTDEKSKPRLSKLAVASLAVPVLLTVAPLITFLLLFCIWGDSPPSRVRAFAIILGELLGYYSRSNPLFLIPGILIPVLSLYLSAKAIYLITTGPEALRGMLYPVASLILTPYYHFAGIGFPILLWGYLANLF